MYDQTTQHAIDNLARQLARVDAGEVGTDALRIGIEALLRVTNAAAVEDREYLSFDLGLPDTHRCGVKHGALNMYCGRRANHVSDTHRCAEISWAVA